MRDEQHSYSLTFTDDEVEDLYLRYMAGATLRELGQKFYCDRGTVAKALKRYEPGCLRSGGRVKGKCYALKRERIVERMPNKTLFNLYKRHMNGERTRDLIREYHLTYGAFYHAMSAVEKVAKHYGYLRSEA